MSDNGYLGLAQVIYSNVAYEPRCPLQEYVHPGKRLTPVQRHQDYCPVQLQDLLPRRLETSPMVLQPVE